MMENVLKKLSAKNEEYLRYLADTEAKAMNNGLPKQAEACRNMARGYIRCLIDSKVMKQDDFKIVFTYYKVLVWEAIKI